MTEVMRAARGRNRAWPSGSVPVWVTPRCFWNLSIAVAVAAL